MNYSYYDIGGGREDCGPGGDSNSGGTKYMLNTRACAVAMGLLPDLIVIVAVLLNSSRGPGDLSELTYDEQELT